MADRVTELERRVLGHLPEWVEDETAFAEAHPTVPREYNLAVFTAKLAGDPECRFMVAGEVRPLGEPEAEHMLELAVSNGHAVFEDREGVRVWRKTRAGREALEVPETPEVDQYPGPVALGLHPGTLSVSDAAVQL